jgi:hypothetical protein
MVIMCKCYCKEIVSQEIYYFIRLKDITVFLTIEIKYIYYKLSLIEDLSLMRCCDANRN